MVTGASCFVAGNRDALSFSSRILILASFKSMNFALVSHTFTDCYCLARINIASYRISRNFFIANIIRVEGAVLARAPFVCWI